MPKFNRDVCEVCGEPVVDLRKLPKEIRDKVHKPTADEYQGEKIINFEGPPKSHEIEDESVADHE